MREFIRRLEAVGPLPARIGAWSLDGDSQFPRLSTRSLDVVSHAKLAEIM